MMRVPDYYCKLKIINKENIKEIYEDCYFIYEYKRNFDIKLSNLQSIIIYKDNIKRYINKQEDIVNILEIYYYNNGNKISVFGDVLINDLDIPRIIKFVN